MATSTIFEPIEIKSKKSVEKFFKMLDEYKPEERKHKIPKGFVVLDDEKKFKKFFKLDK